MTEYAKIFGDEDKHTCIGIEYHRAVATMVAYHDTRGGNEHKTEVYRRGGIPKFGWRNAVPLIKTE